MGTLYIVATPIGNLGDMTPRAVEVLRSVVVIAAEDTRHSATLMRAFDIATPLVSYHKHNERAREAFLLEHLATGDVALISDAGTPAIADPGHAMVEAAIRSGHTIVPIPGASSLLAAVVGSGLVPGQFQFVGFLPRAGSERQVALSRALGSGVPFVLFESPLRTLDTLRDLMALDGARQAVVARELTKLHEEFRRGRLTELVDAISEVPPRGEVVIVVGGPVAGEEVEADSPLQLARTLLASGLKPSKAARELGAITGLSGTEAYAIIREATAITADRMPADGDAS